MFVSLRISIPVRRPVAAVKRILLKYVYPRIENGNLKIKIQIANSVTPQFMD